MAISTLDLFLQPPPPCARAPVIPLSVMCFPCPHSVFCVFAANLHYMQTFNYFVVLLISPLVLDNLDRSLAILLGETLKLYSYPWTNSFLSPVRFFGLRSFEEFVNNFVCVLTCSLMIFVLENHAPIESGRQEEQ